jgi:DNA-binding winged helix-turn-helix (wHTH) protein/Tol biopolymer transport system component
VAFASPQEATEAIRSQPPRTLLVAGGQVSARQPVLAAEGRTYSPDCEPRCGLLQYLGCDFVVTCMSCPTTCLFRNGCAGGRLVAHFFRAALMLNPAQRSGRVSFGEFELNLETAELQRNGSRSILPGQPFQILVTLLDRPGQLVTREELKRQLWPSDTFVDFDISLNKAINRLREALGDSAEHPRFIETFPRKGYRFVGEVRNVAGTESKISEDPVAASRPPAVDVEVSGQESSAETTQEHRAHPYRVKLVFFGGITLLTVVAIVVLLFERFWAPRSPDLASVRITKLTDSGVARDVAISPDGRYVVYSLGHGEKESLRLRQIATRSDIEILPPGPEFQGLTFSPDGIKVYFVRSDRNDPHFKYLYSIPVLGGSAQQMIADVDTPVSFSPDGSKFVFARAVSSRNVIELTIANADGSGERVLSSVRNVDVNFFLFGPSWSPDGRSIVYSFRTLDQEMRFVLVSVSVADGAVREIYSDKTPFGHPVWLSEQELLLVRNEPASQRGELWTISYPNGKALRFTNDLTDYEGPLDIAGDQKTVVAVAVTAVVNVWQADVDNPSVARQITFAQLPMFHVAVTADGRLFAWEGGGSIWSIAPNGQHESFTDSHQTQGLEACNNSIVFIATENKTATLTRVNEDGSNLMKLFSGDVFYAICSPDGKFAYYVNRHRPQKIWRVSTEGGGPTEIGPVTGEGIASALSVSPDGKSLAYTFIQDRPIARKLAIQSASGGPPIKTFDVPGGTYRVRWSAAGTSLQYLVTQDGVTNVWEQPLVGGEAKQLTKFDSGQIFDFTSSFDHKTLFFTRGNVTRDVVMFNDVR